MEFLYRDKALTVIEKPVGMLSQTDAAGGESVLSALEEQGFHPFPVQRLDRGTGGVMVCALTPAAAAKLSVAVQDHEQFRKEYLAVIHGSPADSDGTFEDLLFRDSARNKSFVVARQRKGVKEAKLDYEVLQQSPDKVLTLVRVRLHTGRTHQIRVQFASRQMPLVGDSKYGGRDNIAFPALWSWRLQFRHPFTKKPIAAHSLPDTETYPWSLFDFSSL